MGSSAVVGAGVSGGVDCVADEAAVLEAGALLDDTATLVADVGAGPPLPLEPQAEVSNVQATATNRPRPSACELCATVRN
ncbi:hypothetical protein NS506_04186 [Nocardia seriolae]|uniref:Uncharacterized protein n=1 Tax=Nocardia seriolae TaxID=37332 RepID=A0ABC9YR43_9NOCA|nr:hypothetical protein NS506_04186 [Nocardia seriolae]GAM45936.1 hypothetical protein NS07_v2contig00021-0043 [Nocardia seriolae]GAP27962.1 hypothetical protein NSK11_contig00025-0044 [Nocardia seriolae]